MQFKNPELLYALFLLLIPIIVHLFQLRKFQKEAFTNVAFLKEATIQTRKSSQIKKWLILCTRLLLLAAIILAFAQPFTTNSNTFNSKKETVIYLDNSFSMQAKGNQGELLKRAVQDLISNVPEDENISLITNDAVFKNTTIKAIKNDLLQLDYSSSSITSEAALLKSNTFFSKQKNTLKNLVFISDFQQDKSGFSPQTDSLTYVHLVQLKPVNSNNIAIDSAYISETTPTSIELKVRLTNSGKPIENLPVSLFNDTELIAKTSVAIKDQVETILSLPINDVINGKITIDDVNLQFDNSLFFNINKTSKINVLSINAEDDSFLKRIYTEDEFNFTSTPENQLNYTLLDQQHVIILNELNNIPNALASALKAFTNQGGSLIIIPSTDINLESYNQLLNAFGSNFGTIIKTEKRITSINYSHPLYNSGVFEKQVDNFQYPTIASFYNIISKNASAILKFEDGKPFLNQIKNTYIFTSSLNLDNSSFKNSPLIVPTLYNMGKFSFKNPALYYTIGKENTFDVDISLQQDDILSLVNGDENSIPKQQYFNNKVVINTSETPSIAAIYAIKDKNETIKNVSYNYNRDESSLVYVPLSASKNITVNDSITEIFDTIKSDAKINALWKWFVIFALALLIIEMLILKYFK
ncbi:putative membrane protein (TIGR02226 family) [Mariniflexile fucanivorans]|uniref:Putative membrane protein (TIGR02226 family) n=1 Tax=Mariniflexile fucanivorans TaxID=264023 RepID=A0A4R1RP78_9FLAO|nr:BatA and WFA domain-containing protein [Mariniflexile fucanivorans]TCL68044.1 putative membrane protein (TIGR02226 family) [Mariniflexile fucanivorans]